MAQGSRPVRTAALRLAMSAGALRAAEGRIVSRALRTAPRKARQILRGELDVGPRRARQTERGWVGAAEKDELPSRCWGDRVAADDRQRRGRGFQTRDGVLENLDG
jgi:hypothetical protein